VKMPQSACHCPAIAGGRGYSGCRWVNAGPDARTVTAHPGPSYRVGQGAPSPSPPGAARRLCPVNRRDLELIVQTRASLKDDSARERMQAAGVRQVEMAAVCGVAPSTVSQWLAGVRVPAADKALAFGRALAASERKAALWPEMTSASPGTR
jgi:hypothetical protein